jgi:DNA-binding response OmpR family regulator
MKKILVVDDDVDILTLVKMALTMKGFIVEAIARWEELSNSIMQFKPQLILLDVSLNGADGRDLCKKIKEAEETNHIPVVLFSANSNMGTYIHECHAEAFIAKPFELADLVGTVSSHVA